MRLPVRSAIRSSGDDQERKKKREKRTSDICFHVGTIIFSGNETNTYNTPREIKTNILFLAILLEVTRSFCARGHVFTRAFQR